MPGAAGDRLDDAEPASPAGGSHPVRAGKPAGDLSGHLRAARADSGDGGADVRAGSGKREAGSGRREAGGGVFPLSAIRFPHPRQLLPSNILTKLRPRNSSSESPVRAAASSSVSAPALMPRRK